MPVISFCHDGPAWSRGCRPRLANGPGRDGNAHSILLSSSPSRAVLEKVERPVDRQRQSQGAGIRWRLKRRKGGGGGGEVGNDVDRVRKRARKKSRRGRKVR